MPLVTAKSVLQKARDNGYAVPAFAAYTLESLRAVIETAEELKSPVIIQTTESTLKFTGLSYFADAVQSVATRASIPVVLHLDHGGSVDLVVQCIRAGYTSVMIDASDLPFEQNIQMVRQVVEIAHAVDVSVEAELGHIAGVEDDLSSKYESFTDPAAVEEFVRQTGIDSIAVSIGSSHGMYKVTPSLDLDRLSLISDRVHIPIVLHGASGIPQDLVKAAIHRGINKVNIATELKSAMALALRDFFTTNPNQIDPRVYLNAVKDSVRLKVADIIKMVGSEDMASQ